MLYAVLSLLKCIFLFNTACSFTILYSCKHFFFSWGKEQTFEEDKFPKMFQSSGWKFTHSHLKHFRNKEIKICYHSYLYLNISIENYIEHMHTYTQEQMGALLFITLSCLANLHFLNKATYRYCSCNFSLWNISI